ncbi:50S ribosomal protein L6 [Patescibacteria group bacterium]|nr:50S ribosomal protein L6 [Patescibacteria group bacterium]
MSRIGKQKIEIPNGVTVEVKGKMIKVVGPKGELLRKFDDVVSVVVDNNEVKVSVEKPEEKKQNSLWGTFGSHIKNMIIGVTVGFFKDLEVNGVGYRVSMQGKDLKLEVGYSHPVIYSVPEGIVVTTEKNQIKVTGIDKELVGQVAAEIRKVRKPEPYKGKGIKYIDEVIRRKAGKAAKASA